MGCAASARIWLLAREGLLAAAACGALGAVVGMQDGEDLTDVVTALHRVPQRLICADAIEVTPALALSVEIAGVDEIAHDSLCGAFGHTHPFSDIPESKPGVAGDADQGVCVIGQKRPLRHSGNVPDVSAISPCQNGAGGHGTGKSRYITTET